MGTQFLIAAGEASGTSVLTESLKTAITTGINNLQATVTDVIGITIAASVAVIALTAGVNYALKKIRGVIAKAS